ncbi:MAG: toxic anion resistance protein [Ruminococcaceae bacterium]|nr:toxic anion resistance protein [Oscillospiraceae bacterium]
MEMNEKIPQLTLTPELDSQPVFETKPDTAIAQTPEADTRPEAGPEMAQLSEAEQKAVLEFAEKIDITDTGLVLQYGAGAQKNISDFSGKALNNVRTKDMGEVGEMLSDLVMELKGFDAEEERKGLRGLFRKANSGMEMMKVKYDKAEANVEKVSRQLEGHKITLLGDIARLDQMYEQNLEYYKQLTMYILAGQKALKKAKEVTLPQMRAEAAASALPSDAQKVNDYANMCDRFEKRLHDLELTRVICLQMAPQIRMIQNNDTLMTEKIQTSLVSTIPLWKSQMVLALGIEDSKRALEAQREVTDVTNALLRRNADMLKQATLETAKEAERGVVDIETLQHTNTQLITTLDEVLQIQTEGAQKRLAAEKELRRIEGELKQKLLQARG